ncbi:MAG: GNAT family N-acetyltransferase [Acidobacteria bacterium]|nr:GNAT family N-acetyltransferase [Acidobacteriota bacterium]
MRPWERNAANLAASLSFYGPVSFTPGLRLITSRVAYSVFNIALLDSPVSEPYGPMGGELERRIEAAAAHYRSRNRPWSFWICESFLGPHNSRRLLRIFEACGLQCIAESPGMEAEDFPPLKRRLPELEYRPVSDAATRADFAGIVSQCFHIPPAVADLVYDSEADFHAPLEIWMGYHEGQAITSAAVIHAADAIGIYSVATLPLWRGQGLAEAVMRHAVNDVRRRGGAGPLVLQSSPSGYELYRRLGFRRVTRYFVFATN